MNSYDYGKFREDPNRLMERFFDLHLHLANWGTRRLMERLPRRAVDEHAILAALEACGGCAVRVVGDSLVLTVQKEDDEDGECDGVDDGDWLLDVSAGGVDDAEAEPFAGLGPVDRVARTFAMFFVFDQDLLAAARRAAEAQAAELA